MNKMEQEAIRADIELKIGELIVLSKKMKEESKGELAREWDYLWADLHKARGRSLQLQSTIRYS